MNTKLRIKEIEVFFFGGTCYRCGKEYGLYSVEKIITEDGQVLKATPSLDYSDNDLMYDAEIVRLVRLYLEDHPELKYDIGQIKKRDSATTGSSYVSFGCPDCDAIIGKYYVYEYYVESNYDLDEHNVTIKTEDYIGRTAPIVTPRFSNIPKIEREEHKTKQAPEIRFRRFVYTLSNEIYIATEEVVEGERYSDTSLVELDIIGENITEEDAKQIGLSYILKNDIRCKQCSSCISRNSSECYAMSRFFDIVNSCKDYIRDIQYVDGLCSIPANVTIHRIV